MHPCIHLIPRFFSFLSPATRTPGSPPKNAATKTRFASSCWRRSTTRDTATASIWSFPDRRCASSSWDSGDRRRPCHGGLAPRRRDRQRPCSSALRPEAASLPVKATPGSDGPSLFSLVISGAAPSPLACARPLRRLGTVTWSRCDASA